MSPTNRVALGDCVPYPAQDPATLSQMPPPPGVIPGQHVPQEPQGYHEAHPEGGHEVPPPQQPGGRQ
eukprot:12938388-Prorocentrum_lima.AAC.1